MSYCRSEFYLTFDLDAILHLSEILFNALNFNDNAAQPFKLNLNKKLDPKQKTIKAFNIDA